MRQQVLEVLRGFKVPVKEGKNTIFVSAERSRCLEILSALKKKFANNCHLSSIAGNDLDDGRFEVNYLLLVENVSVLVKTETKREVESVTKIFPGAILYERELYEMFGVGVTGHPDLRNFFLPKELTRAGTYPLRKSLTNGQIRDELGKVAGQ